MIIILSLWVNVLVAGYMGAVTVLRAPAMLPRLDEVFGPDGPGRRILGCLYLSIAAASVVALAVPSARLLIVVVLFPLQIFYKLLTIPVVGDVRNPVPWCNLAISALHAVSLWFAWGVLRAAY
jgi:hypothetical protein